MMNTETLRDRLAYMDGRLQVAVDTGGASWLDVADVVEDSKHHRLVLKCASPADDAVRLMLDAYFETRLPLPLDEVTPPELKTTLDIQDDLRDMLAVGNARIVAYMLSRAYTTATVLDGTVRWKIWRRRIDGDML